MIARLIAKIKNTATMNLILIIVGIFLLLFTVTILIIFCATGMEPSTLVGCVFGACGLEGGIMGWIKTTKEKNKDREWQLEDDKRQLEDDKRQHSNEGGNGL